MIMFYATADDGPVITGHGSDLRSASYAARGLPLELIAMCPGEPADVERIRRKLGHRINAVLHRRHPGIFDDIAAIVAEENARQLA